MSASLWKLFFDGLCEPKNPGGTMGFGWLLDTGDGQMYNASGFVHARPDNTNNVAEYLALYEGLKKAVEIRQQWADTKYPGLLIHGDSQLVCYQIEYKWKVNHPRLQVAHAKCMELLTGQLTPFLVEWIPRELNSAADALSRQAYFDATGMVPRNRDKGAA